MSELLLAGGVVAVPAMLLFAVAGSRWPALAVCLVPLSFPIEQLELPGLPMRVVQLACVAAIGLVGIHQRARRLPNLASSPVLFAAGLVVLSALASTVVSVDPAAALRLDAGYLLGLAFAGAVALACVDRRSLRLLIGCTCLVGTVICVAGLKSATQLRAHFGAGVVDNRATGFFGQPNEMGAFAAIMVVLGLAMFFSYRRLVPRLMFGASVLISAATLVVSLSRGSWLGLALGLVVFVILAPSVRRFLMRGLVVAFAAIAVTVAALPSSPLVSIVVDRAASLVDGSRNPYDYRPEIWREALRQIGQRPVLGSGPGGYPVLALRVPSRVTTVVPNHAHDLALTVTAEQGLLGVAALIVAVAVAAVAVIRTIRVRSGCDYPSGWTVAHWVPVTRAWSDRDGSSRDGSSWDGSTRDGSMWNGSSRDGSSRDGDGRGNVRSGKAGWGSSIWDPEVGAGPGQRDTRKRELAPFAVRQRGEITATGNVAATGNSATRIAAGDTATPAIAPAGIAVRGILIRGFVMSGDAAREVGQRGVGDRELLAGAVGALAVVLGQGLLDYPLRNPVIATTVWLLVGLLAATVSVRDQSWRRRTEDIAVRHVREVRVPVS